MHCLSIRCARRSAVEPATGFARSTGPIHGAGLARARTTRRVVRYLTLVCMITVACEAAALDSLDLVGAWKGDDKKIHRLDAYGFNNILLCRPVANVKGGVRAYRGTFAEGGFELVSKPRSIDDLNNRLPAALRRDLLRLGASYSAKVKLADKGRRLIVQFIGGTVTWSKDEPGKAISIKKAPGEAVTLTRIASPKNGVEVARRKAVRAIARMEHQNRGHADATFGSMARQLYTLSDERWLSPERRGEFEYRARAISGAGAMELPESKLLNLEPQRRWARDFHTPSKYSNPVGLQQNRYNAALTLVSETMAKVRRQMWWVDGLLRAQIAMRKLREALPDATAAATGLSDMRAISRLFRDAHYARKVIEQKDYAAFVALYSRLKPELAAIAKSKTVAKPMATTGRPPKVPVCRIG